MNKVDFFLQKPVLLLQNYKRVNCDYLQHLKWKISIQIGACTVIHQIYKTCSLNALFLPMQKRMDATMISSACYTVKRRSIAHSCNANVLRNVQFEISSHRFAPHIKIVESNENFNCAIAKKNSCARDQKPHNYAIESSA